MLEAGIWLFLAYSIAILARHEYSVWRATKTGRALRKRNAAIEAAATKLAANCDCMCPYAKAVKEAVRMGTSK